MCQIRKLLAISVFAVLAIAHQKREPVSIARKALDLLLDGKYPDLRAMFTQRMLDALSEEDLGKKVGPQIRALGKLEKIGDAATQRVQNMDVVVFPCKFAGGNFDFLISVDEANKIAGLFFRPGAGPKDSGSSSLSGWTRPSYSHPGSFREREVFVGTDEWKLPGSLTLPIQGGPFAGVVLVQGSGPQDRDETISANKPFRDLAEGLASRGIAVLRYDKRTLTYGPQMAALRDFTVQQETVDDARRAISLLRQQPEIDPKQVFLLGHSLGGYLGPRIAQQDGKLAGLIILAGSARPMEDLILEQSQYLGASPEQRQQLTAKVTKIKNLKRDGNDSGVILGAPASYWLDLQGYGPAAEAARLKCRLLLLQGGRDYQVSQADFALWQAALKGREDVTFHAYPALNHLFISGQGKSLPAEYDKPGHVSGEVIDAIAFWIEK